ncbi:MAG: hypothetical protein HZB15_16195 [Actinobacteria bacterium]|nr:hypothetical protein [Actinomycetota bacterium]
MTTTITPATHRPLTTGDDLDPTRGNAAESPVTRISTRFGVAFGACQIAVMIAMSIFVLPKGGLPGDPAFERGRKVLDAATAYRIGNFVFMASSVLLLGFLGAVHHRLRRVDRTSVLPTVAVASGTLLALIWPLAGALHDVAIEAATNGADPRILAGWDSVAPFALAFSALVRVFFIGSVVLGLRLAGTAPRLQRLGIALVPVSVVGSATLVSGALFPVLALSTLAYELWVVAVAWTWLRRS